MNPFCHQDNPSMTLIIHRTMDAHCTCIMNVHKGRPYYVHVAEPVDQQHRKIKVKQSSSISLRIIVLVVSLFRYLSY